MYKRTIFHTLLKRIQEPRRFIQVLAGPRQVGKTTIARQVMEAVSIPVNFTTARLIIKIAQGQEVKMFVGMNAG